MNASGLEIERTYLLAAAPSEATLGALGARPVRIEQAYLRAEDDWVTNHHLALRPALEPA